MADERGRGLTRHEFDAVIRRAAELASSDAESESGLDEAELFRIGGEVGLSPQHVRQALAEVRSGQRGGTVLDRMFGASFIRASRTVPGSPARLAEQIDDFLVASQLLQRVRRSEGLLQYRPSVDWASKVARAASFSSRKYYIASARSVEVRLDVVDDGRTLVELTVDPGTRRDDVAGAAVAGGVGGVGTGVASGLVLASVASLVLAIPVGIAAGAGVGAGVVFGVARAHQRKTEEVRAEVEGVLDALEAGRSLEPPPPSWRRWVKRHFHGMARDLMRDKVD